MASYFLCRVGFKAVRNIVFIEVGGVENEKFKTQIINGVFVSFLQI